MTLQSFKESLLAPDPPANISDYLKALWHDANGNWDKAHTIIQDVKDKNASWIHAYLHRKEGDIFNADYWYTRSGKNNPQSPLDKEWEQIVIELL
ncbi:MAG: hypothetical protein ABIO55_05725 [Ginsengibacter sp.]